MNTSIKYGPKTRAFVASLAWLDRLPEVGDPLRKLRDEAIEVMDRAEQWELQALSLSLTARTAAHQLEQRCAQLWSVDELATAKGIEAADAERTHQDTAPV